MLSETLTSGLERYKIGAKIRALRLKKQIGLVQLGAHTGLSAAMLSKIERGQVFPTLPTLLRVALVFGVGLEHFFAETEARRAATVIRKAERLRLPNRPGASPAYLFESLDFLVNDRQMESYLAIFPAGSNASDPHKHAGAELLYVIRGQLTVTVDGEELSLAEGDAISFDSGAAHSYRREGRSACEALVVVVPK